MTPAQAQFIEQRIVDLLMNGQASLHMNAGAMESWACLFNFYAAYGDCVCVRRMEGVYKNGQPVTYLLITRLPAKKGAPR